MNTGATACRRREVQACGSPDGFLGVAACAGTSSFLADSLADWIAGSAVPSASASFAVAAASHAATAPAAAWTPHAPPEGEDGAHSREPAGPSSGGGAEAQRGLSGRGAQPGPVAEGALCDAGGERMGACVVLRARSARWCGPLKAGAKHEGGAVSFPLLGKGVR
jgi:hypothetical protein